MSIINGTKEEDKTVQKEAAGSAPTADRAGFNCGGRLRGSQLPYTGDKAQGRGKSSCQDRAAENPSKGKKENAKVKVETPKQRLKRVEITAKQIGYPDSVVGLLGKNKETVDFVEDYEAKKDVPAADNIGESYVGGTDPAIAAMGRALGLCFLRYQHRGGKRMRANLYGYGSGRA